MKAISRKLLRGFTLVELLVGAATALLLMGGLSMALATGLSFFKKQSIESDFQERLRYAFYILERDIENAGFLSCIKMRMPESPVILASPSLAPRFRDFIAFSPLSKERRVVENGAYLWVAYAVGEETVELNGYSTLKSALPRIRLNPLDALVLTDCHHAVLFAVKRDKKKFYVDGPLELPFSELGLRGPRIYVTGVRSVDYYLHGDSQKLGTGIKRLFRNDEELISGVRDFKISYGIDSRCAGQVIFHEDLPVDPAYTMRALKVQLTLKVGSGFQKSERIFYLPNSCFGDPVQ